jgi:hypothetical protein
LPAKYVPHFKPGKELRERIDKSVAPLRDKDVDDESAPVAHHAVGEE